MHDPMTTQLAVHHAKRRVAASHTDTILCTTQCYTYVALPLCNPSKNANPDPDLDRPITTTRMQP
jgi:hypothetical protein